MTIRVKIQNLEGAEGKNIIVKSGENPASIIEPGGSCEIYIYKGHDLLCRESRRSTIRRGRERRFGQTIHYRSPAAKEQ